ncbi:uncharacterized protein LOC110252590, partial [Exaiptasia diaphana]|uniref:Uncharacterized protein n=1 Tax=Exaiptasia diaphana TaxID=2652724 RepID=A0A913Y6E9_EXADI
MSCEKFGYEFSWIIPLLCCFPFLYANASTIKASREIENVPAFVGGDLRYSWQINTQNLSRIVLLLDNVHVLSSKKGNFPGTSCVVLMSKKILNLCKNKIKPNSSVKDGKFNLVINRITEKYLDKSVWKLILDYPKTQNLSSSIRIMLKETSAPTPGCPTGSCKPCPPTPGCPTGSCKPCPPNPGCPSIPCPTPSSDNDSSTSQKKAAPEMKS